MPIRLEIVTAERQVYADNVDYVVLPGQEGELGILPNHAPLVTTLKTGELRIRLGSFVEYFAVAGGFAQVRPDKVVVLADAAERSEEIDEARADQARDRAEQALREHPEQATASLQALRRANLRLQVVRRRRSSLPAGTIQVS